MGAGLLRKRVAFISVEAMLPINLLMINPIDTTLKLRFTKQSSNRPSVARSFTCGQAYFSLYWLMNQLIIIFLLCIILNVGIISHHGSAPSNTRMAVSLNG